jgi:hypothetical protein
MEITFFVKKNKESLADVLGATRKGAATGGTA